MDSEHIIKQGKALAGKLRDSAGEQAAQHEEQIKGVLGKVVGFVNDKTGGKYADQVGKVAGYVEQGVDQLASTNRTDDTPGNSTPPPPGNSTPPPPGNSTPPPPGNRTDTPEPPTT